MLYNVLQETVQSAPSAHCFQQSSYMSYSNIGKGQPQVYQATSSVRTAPGGVSIIIVNSFVELHFVL